MPRLSVRAALLLAAALPAGAQMAAPKVSAPAIDLTTAAARKPTPAEATPRDPAEATPATPARPPAPAVLEVTAADFDDNKCPVYDGPGDFVILAFYARWCDNSRRFMKAYDEMALLFEQEGNFTLAKIDAEAQENLPLARYYKVRGYPSLFYFHKQEKKPYTRTDFTEIKKLLDAGKVQPALFVKYFKTITDDVFAEAGVGQPHDEF